MDVLASAPPNLLLTRSLISSVPRHGCKVIESPVPVAVAELMAASIGCEFEGGKSVSVSDPTHSNPSMVP